ncbi:putative protein TPRXL [Lucilia cuprina]|uniref:putative protein TPRXL n=1 Tax=Lucilia cuprina TaxID=7375 RepID=UPI001F06718E|nr:putative protein TPRXL [Lucilia cuprina]
MDLLCTENIMHEYETEILQQHQHLPHKSPLIITANEEHLSQDQETQTAALLRDNSNKNDNNTTTTTITTTSPPSLYSSSSSLLSSATSCSSTNSSGYNSSSSSSSNSSLSSSNNPLTSSTSSTISSTSSSSSSSILSNNNYCLSSKLQCDEDSNEFVDNLCSTNNASTSANNNQQEQQQQNTVYANNLINRSLDYVNTATEDPTFLTDRCLENALKAEEKRPQPICTYFKTVQMDITPPMRKIVAEWMMEVCAEEKCQEEVVLLALNYMDRFLSTRTVRKTHLQILAAACLLLASKLREPSCRALSAELLVFYTDNSIHKADLIVSTPILNNIFFLFNTKYYSCLYYTFNI